MLRSSGSLLLTLALAVFSRDAFEWNILESLTDKEFLGDPRLNNPWNH